MALGILQSFLWTGRIPPKKIVPHISFPVNAEKALIYFRQKNEVKTPFIATFHGQENGFPSSISKWS